jgi:hypothetical protein
MFEMIPSTIQTGPTQMSEFTKFIGDAFGEIRKRHALKQSTVCHYTNVAGFYGITNSTTLHATHIAYMNDADEFKHALDLLLEIVLESKTPLLSQPQSRILNVLKSALERASVADYFPMFIVCFSSLHNDLSQWRAYGGQAGIGIGVGVQHLDYMCAKWNLGTDYLGYAGAAIYDNDEKREILKEVVTYVLNRYPLDEASSNSPDLNDYSIRWARDFFSLAATLAPLFKNREFVAEREWRLVVTPKKSSLVDFKAKQSLLTPFIKLPLGSEYENFKHPIRRVVVGPARYKDLNYQAVRSLLSLRYGAGIEIEVSGIPYRDVS